MAGIEQNDYVKDVTLDGNISKSEANLNQFLEEKFEDFQKEMKEKGGDPTKSEEEFNSYVDAHLEEIKNKELANFVKRNTFKLNEYTKVVKIPKYDNFAYTGAIENNYFSEMKQNFLNNLLLRGYDEDKATSMVVDQVGKLEGNQNFNVVRNMPNLLEEQHKKLTKALFEHHIPIDNREIKKDMDDLAKDTIKELFYDGKATILPSQYAEKLYPKYSKGGHLATVDHQGIDLYELSETKKAKQERRKKEQEQKELESEYKKSSENLFGVDINKAPTFQDQAKTLEENISESVTINSNKLVNSSSVVKQIDHHSQIVKRLQKNSIDQGEKMDTKKAGKKVIKEIMPYVTSSYVNKMKPMSKQEKHLMEDFVDLVHDLENNEGTTADNIESVLLSFIKNNATKVLSYGEHEWKQFMNTRNISVTSPNRLKRTLFGKKGVKTLQKIAQAYVSATNAHGSDQYPMFGVFTDLVLDHGSFQGIYDTYKDDIQKQSEYVHKVLGGNEFSSEGTRLRLFNAAINGKYSDVEKNVDTQISMLCDFNLDGVLNYGDAFNKTGLQLRDLLNKGDKQQNLKNLVDAFNNGNKTNAEKINSGKDFIDQKKFDAFQNFVKAPPIDLHLIIEHGTNAISKNIDRAKNSIDQQKKIDDFVKNEGKKLKKNTVMRISNLESKSDLTEEEKQELQALKKIKSIPDVQFYEGLKEIIGASLLRMEGDGLAVGTGVGLDQLLPGLSFNVGASTSGFGINLKLNKSANLGELTKIYGGASVGTLLFTVPMVSVNGGISHTFENKNSKKSLDTNIGADKTIHGGVHGFALPGAFGWGVDAGVDTDRLAMVNKKYESLKTGLSALAGKIVDKMKDDNNNFSYNRNLLVNKDRTGLLQTEYPKTKNFDKVLDTMEPLLQYFHGQKLDESGVREVIVQSFQDAYALQWKNKALENLNNEGWYLSGGGLSVTFLEGVIPVIGLLKFKKHDITGSRDTFASRKKTLHGNRFGIGNETLGESLNENTIDALNKKLGADILSLQNGLVKVNVKVLNGVELHIDPAMQGLMKKDDDGNILLHPETPVRAFTSSLGKGKVRVLNIGNDTSNTNDIVVRSEKDINNNMFTDGTIDVDKLPSIGEVKLTKDNFKKALNDLKNDFPEYKDLFSLLSFENEKIKYKGSVNDLYIPLDYTKNIKITINKDNELKFSNFPRIGNALTISVEVAGKKEKINPIEVGVDTQNEINDFYNQMSNIKYNTLANISHHPEKYGLGNLYKNWRKALNDQTYDKAKTSMLEMLPKIQERINKYGEVVDFKTQISFLEDATKTDVQKNQLLLALDGMFSRTTNVKGLGNNKYKLEYGNTDKNAFEKIIKGNKEAIIDKMRRDGVDKNVVLAYKTMFDKMNVNYQSLKNLKEVQAVPLTGLAYNYGNRQDNERPIINPMIVKDSLKKIEDLGLDDDTVTTIKQHMAKQLMSKDRALIQPMIDKLRNDLKNRKDINDPELNDNDIIKLLSGVKIKKSVDKGKPITIKAEYDLVTALFAQCVNHMIIAQNIKFKVDGQDIDVQGRTVSTSIRSGGVVVNESEGDVTYGTNTSNAAFAGGGRINTDNKKNGGTTTPDSDSDGETVPDGEDNNKDVNHDSDVNKTEDNDF